MKKIVLAFDSFKGSLTSSQVADAFELGVRSCCDNIHVVKVPMADGGEGTLDAISPFLSGERVCVEVADPLGRPVMASYVMAGNGHTAVIEMAQCCGLTLLSDEERNPMLTTTYGMGQLISDALSRGCRKVVCFIGGSATNDGGTGMLSALGFRFCDSNGCQLKGCGQSLRHIAYADASDANPLIAETEFVVACDVENPLCGRNGAAYAFAPQKGADRKMTELLDEGLRNYAHVVSGMCHADIAALPGGGAAGGLGAGMMALLDARFQKGCDVVLDIIGFDDIIKDADLVVTGEGKIDCQTLMGKAPLGVMSRAGMQGISTVAIGGMVEWCDALLESGFSRIIAIADPAMPLHEAMQPNVARENVRKAAESIIRQ